MAIVADSRFTYIADGVTQEFPITFDYITAGEVFVEVDGTPSPRTITLNVCTLPAAPAIGVEVVVYRNTDAVAPQHSFSHGSPFLPRYIDDNFRQVLHAVQEGISVSDSALSVAQGIDAKATEALSTANAIDAFTQAAVVTANAADAKADQSLINAATAVNTANSANSTAQGIAATANLALQQAQASDAIAGDARDTADNALAVALGVNAKADTALSTSQQAESTANAIAGTAASAETKADLALLRSKAVSDYVGYTEEYQGPYGLTWDSTTDTYVRTGAQGYTAIQSQMRRCVLTATGTVAYYLDPTNSNFKEDGTPANLTGADGNVMVQIPKFYVKYDMDSTLRKQSIGLTPELGYALHPAFIKSGVEVPYRYYRAYAGVVQLGKLLSVSGVTPTRSLTIAQFRTYAMAYGTGWHQIDWNLLNAVRTLLFIEIGTLDSQAVLGTGNHTSQVYGRTTGVSNTIGNASSPANTAEWMSYRGIENFYGDCWEFIDGINVNNYVPFINQDWLTFASDVYTGDYVTTGITMPAASASYIKDMHFSPLGIIPTAIGGSSVTHACDALWTATGSRIVFFGGSANSGAAAGASCLIANDASSAASVYLGAGVAF